MPPNETRIDSMPLLFLLAVAALHPAASPASAADFRQDIEPIFHQHCYSCHGPAQQMSGLRLDRKDAALKGGYSGAIVVPGDSSESKLMARVTSDKEGFRMPPAGAPLTPKEIDLLRAWIEAGAEWPELPARGAVSSNDGEKHWSFQPIAKPFPPRVSNPAWSRNPIDRFTLARLDGDNIEPSPEADKITLLRRVYFDLIGLPPTPDQVAAFVNDTDPRGFENVVDELLRSPHYGEKWAMHWLDAARYADSDGYERDPLRPFAWRWRQWIIEAINRDMPFDRFTIEQIAGDLLPHASTSQRVATGFLRNGTKNREAGVQSAEKRFEETIDRISTIGTVWLGVTVGCAQCHDHKYDPLSQREFYQLFAFFHNTVERDIEAPLPGESGPLLRELPAYYAARGKILDDNSIPELQAAWRERMIEAMENPGVNTDWDFYLTEWRAANDRADWLMRTGADELTQLERDKVTDWFLRLKGPAILKAEELKKRFDEIREQLTTLVAALPTRTRAYTMIERSEPVAAHIALRGDFRAPGVEVDPRTPAVLPPVKNESEHPRLQLAEWLVSAENPLTARVTVNRMWQEFFGRGLVRTVGDFGTQGAAPSHPRLLDWLAAEFQAAGWSRKQIHRLIVTSATYRQSSRARPDLSEIDPENKLLARQNRLRLPAELLRDNALAVSGLLYPKIGGPSAFPPQPPGVAEIGYAKKEWKTDQGPERYRRGLYIHFQRTAPYPMLVNFDAPDTLTAAPRRERSNTALQALNQLNDAALLEAAQALAVRVMTEAPGDGFADRLDHAYRLCLSRTPDSGERDRLTTFWKSRERAFAEDPESARQLVSFVPPDAAPAETAAWVSLARALLNLDEFITRE